MKARRASRRKLRSESGASVAAASAPRGASAQPCRAAWKARGHEIFWLWRAASRPPSNAGVRCSTRLRSASSTPARSAPDRDSPDEQGRICCMVDVEPARLNNTGDTAWTEADLLHLCRSRQASGNDFAVRLVACFPIPVFRSAMVAELEHARFGKVICRG